MTKPTASVPPSRTRTALCSDLGRKPGAGSRANRRLPHSVRRAPGESPPELAARRRERSLDRSAPAPEACAAK